jgi:hypothetical protein
MASAGLGEGEGGGVTTGATLPDPAWRGYPILAAVRAWRMPPVIKALLTVRVR